MPQIPKLVNRGAAGLLTKTPAREPQGSGEAPRAFPVNKIVKELEHLAVLISSLTPDPDNARLHPDRNIEAIQQSLADYGQCSPVVVRKQNGVIMKGNGTVESALKMGWTKIAAVFIEMTDAEAAGYGLADNRTAELAKWDFETVARLDRLVTEAGHHMVGWSTDELEVLRMADWCPPAPAEGGQFGSGDKENLLVGFTPDQHEAVTLALTKLHELVQVSDQAEGISLICKDWLNGK